MKFFKRKWLNKKEGSAFCTIELEKTGKHYTSAHLKIADCFKIINLEFDVDHTRVETDYQNGKFKLAALKEMIAEFETRWEKMVENVRESKKKNKKS